MDGGCASKGQRVGQRGLIAVLAFLGLGLGPACAPAGGGGTGMEIRVTPLQFNSVLDVCYDIQVFDNIGTLLWSAGDPNVNRDQGDTATICSSDYGTGSGGDIQYIGSCDPTFNPNIVAIIIDGIYTINGRLQDGVDWLPTCTVADPCYQYVECQPDANVLVAFNILVMRSANQGFFDIAVKFDDVFCSAKVDCTYDAAGAEPIMAVNTDGTDLQTVVVGVACTAGPDTLAEDVQSILHENDVRIVCGDLNGPQPEAFVWTCEADQPNYYGYSISFPSTGPELLGTEVARDPGTLDYTQSPLFVNGLPVEYSTAVIYRVLADADAPKEAIAVFVTPPDNPLVEGPVRRVRVGLVKKTTPPWDVSWIAEPLENDIVMPCAYDGTNLIAVNTLDDVLPFGARVIAYQVVGSPGDRKLETPIQLDMPVDVSECGRFQLLNGYFIADCRRRRELGGTTYEAAEGVLWIQNVNEAADYAVLVPPTGETHFRLSEVDQAGLQIGVKDIVIALNARFQWSQPPGFNPPTSDDRTYDSQAFAVIYRCANHKLAECKPDNLAPKVPKYIGHETATVERLDTHARSIVNNHVLGRFAFQFEAFETRAAVFELLDGPDSNSWTEWRDPVGKPVADVTLSGIFPDARIVFGFYGPFEDSPLDGSGPRQRLPFFAKLPATSGTPVDIKAIPVPAGSEVREFLGRAGPESQLRFLVKMARVGNAGVVIEEVGQYVFKSDFSSFEQLIYVGPDTFYDSSPTNDELHDFGFARDIYARDRAMETVNYDAVVPNCPQFFGSVGAMVGQQALVVDPQVDLDPTQPPPADPNIATVTLAWAEPLGAPQWFAGLSTYSIINPAGDEGYHWHNGDAVIGTPANPRPADADPVLLNYGIYRGVEELDCGNGSCNKLYWNVAVGFDPTVPNCTLYFDATASASTSLLPDGSLPEGTYWPWLEATVPLTGPSGGLVCTQHPMGSGAYPAVAHAMTAANQGCYKYDGFTATRAAWCSVPEYWLRYREWTP